MLNESNTWPGTTSSGAYDVSGVTNPSPSKLISSGELPVAVLYARVPPLIKVSRLFTSVGTVLPSESSFRNTTRAPSAGLTFNVNVPVLPSPTIVGVFVGSCLTPSK